MRLLELFGRSTQWQWAGSYGPAEIALFELDSVNYMVGFTRYEELQGMADFPNLQHEDVWLAGFATEVDGEWRQDTVGGTDATTVSVVIRTFLEIVQAFLTEHRPPVLAIPAVVDREKIYAQIAKRVDSHARELGYVFSGKEEATFPEHGKSVVFYFVRNDLAESQSPLE